MSDVMIEARNLSKTYGTVRAIDKVSFEVRKGEVLGFLGPNGAGKTTTMKILTCFIAPTDGTAKVNGHDVFEDPLGVRKAIGYLPESTPLYTEMMVLEYLDFVAQMRGLKGDEKKARIKKTCEATAITDVIAKHIGELSKGYRQRVGIAQALIHEPPILILDEPMSGLDPNQAIEIRDLIKRLGKERTVILSTHNLDEVHKTCDRVLIIARGKIVADDKPADLVDRAGKNRFIVAIQKGDGVNGESARSKLASVPGVDKVRPLEAFTYRDAADPAGEFAFEVMPVGTEDLRAAIFKACVAENMILVGLRREGQNLEQIFRELTTGPAAKAAAAAASDADDEDEEDEEEENEAPAAEAKADAKPEPEAKSETKSDDAKSEETKSEEKKEGE
jgi:ABC-2 type transport system ATP-binding protein